MNLSVAYITIFFHDFILCNSISMQHKVSARLALLVHYRYYYCDMLRLDIYFQLTQADNLLTLVLLLDVLGIYFRWMNKNWFQQCWQWHKNLFIIEGYFGIQSTCAIFAKVKMEFELFFDSFIKILRLISTVHKCWIFII